MIKTCRRTNITMRIYKQAGINVGPKVGHQDKWIIRPYNWTLWQLKSSKYFPIKRPFIWITLKWKIRVITRRLQCLIRVITKRLHCLIRVITTRLQCLIRVITSKLQCLIRVITRRLQCLIRVITRRLQCLIFSSDEIFITQIKYSQARQQSRKVYLKQRSNLVMIFIYFFIYHLFLKAFIKAFEAPQRSVKETLNLIFILMQFFEMHRTGYTLFL